MITGRLDSSEEITDMYEIGTQTKNVVYKDDPAAGFDMLAAAGFSCADFSLNEFLLNTELYKGNKNDFFSKSIDELKEFFEPYKEGAAKAGIRINQMHMPYPMYVPTVSDDINDFLRREMMPKSIEICAFFGCRNIVVHGLKLSHFLGSEEAEWAKTEEYLSDLAPMAKELNVTMCIENLYTSIGNHIVEGSCCNAARACERIDRINARYGAEVLGFCFDTGHANIVGIDMEDFITTLGHRLKVLHIHDNDGRQDLHQIPFLFARTRENKPSTDWDGFVRGLKAADFHGVLSFETAPVLTSFPDEMKEDALELIAKVGRYFGGRIEM